MSLPQKNSFSNFQFWRSVELSMKSLVLFEAKCVGAVRKARKYLLPNFTRSILLFAFWHITSEGRFGPGISFFHSEHSIFWEKTLFRQRKIIAERTSCIKLKFEVNKQPPEIFTVIFNSMVFVFN